MADKALTPTQLGIGIAVGAVVIALVVVAQLARTGGSDDGVPRGVPISASELEAAFRANEVSADARYKGHRVELQEPIARIDKDIGGDPFVVFEPGVQCVFPKSRADELLGLNPGNVVRVSCEVRGLMLNVILDDCGTLSPR